MDREGARLKEGEQGARNKGGMGGVTCRLGRRGT